MLKKMSIKIESKLKFLRIDYKHLMIRTKKKKLTSQSHQFYCLKSHQCCFKISSSQIRGMVIPILDFQIHGIQTHKDSNKIRLGM